LQYPVPQSNGEEANNSEEPNGAGGASEGETEAEGDEEEEGGEAEHKGDAAAGAEESKASGDEANANSAAVRGGLVGAKPYALAAASSSTLVVMEAIQPARGSPAASERLRLRTLSLTFQDNSPALIETSSRDTDLPPSAEESLVHMFNAPTWRSADSEDVGASESKGEGSQTATTVSPDRFDSFDVDGTPRRVTQIAACKTLALWVADGALFYEGEGAAVGLANVSTPTFLRDDVVRVSLTEKEGKPETLFVVTRAGVLWGAGNNSQKQLKEGPQKQFDHLTMFSIPVSSASSTKKSKQTLEGLVDVCGNLAGVALALDNKGRVFLLGNNSRPSVLPTPFVVGMIAMATHNEPMVGGIIVSQRGDRVMTFPNHPRNGGSLKPFTQLLSGEVVVQVDSGRTHVACVTSLGRVLVMGHNAHKQLGQSDTSARVDTLVELCDSHAVMVAASDTSTIILKQSGEVVVVGNGADSPVVLRPSHPPNPATAVFASGGVVAALCGRRPATLLNSALLYWSSDTGGALVLPTPPTDTVSVNVFSSTDKTEDPDAEASEVPGAGQVEWPLRYVSHDRVSTACMRQVADFGESQRVAHSFDGSETKAGDVNASVSFVLPAVCVDPKHQYAWFCLPSTTCDNDSEVALDLVCTFPWSSEAQAKSLLADPNLSVPSSTIARPVASASQLAATFLGCLDFFHEQAAAGVIETKRVQAAEHKAEAPLQPPPADKVARFKEGNMVTGWGMGSEDWVTVRVDTDCELVGFGVLAGTIKMSGVDRLFEVRFRVLRCCLRLAAPL